MLGYLTEIDLKQQVVRTTFGKEVRTFVYGEGLPLEEVLKVAAEDFGNQLRNLLKEMLEHIDHLKNDVLVLNSEDKPVWVPKGEE